MKRIIRLIIMVFLFLPVAKASIVKNTQAAHWIIQDITEHVDDFAGKKWNIEMRVNNSDGNAAFIDVASDEITPMMIEYKWLTTNTVSKDDFIREFIKRDLFNGTDLSKIQWRIKGQKLTKEKVVEYMSSSEGREALKKAISEDKVKQFFPLQTAQISENNYVDFLINKFKQDETFNQIFK